MRATNYLQYCSNTKSPFSSQSLSLKRFFKTSFHVQWVTLVWSYLCMDNHACLLLVFCACMLCGTGKCFANTEKLLNPGSNLFWLMACTFIIQTIYGFANAMWLQLNRACSIPKYAENCKTFFTQLQNDLIFFHFTCWFDLNWYLSVTDSHVYCQTIIWWLF